MLVMWWLGGRGMPPHGRWRAAAWWGGVATLIAALNTPIDAQADDFLWVHMVQHVLLLVVAPPLIVLARPWDPALHALGPRSRTLAGTPQRLLNTHRRRVLAAAAAVVAFVAVMWFWHIPALYNLTLREDLVHNLEHTAFLAVGLLFWTAALPRPAGDPSIGLIGRSVVVLAGLVGSWLLAVYIGYAPGVLYAYGGSGGLSALADQQLAAGVMWVPASIPFAAAVVWIMARWFENDARLVAAEARVSSEVPA